MLTFLMLATLALQSTDFEKGLKAKEFEVRLATVQTLVRDTDPRTEKLLVAATRDEDWEVALRATEGLGERKVKSATDALVKLALDAPIRRIRTAAANALLAIAPEEAASALLRKLGGGDVVPVLEALAVLTAGRDAKSDLATVLKTAEKAKESAARAAAAAVAGGTGFKDRERAFPKLIGRDAVRSVCAALDAATRSPRSTDLAALLDLLARPKLDDCVERRAIAAARAACTAREAPLPEERILASLAPLIASKTPAVSARGARLVERFFPARHRAAPQGAGNDGPSTGGPGGGAEPAAPPPAPVLAPDRALEALEPALKHSDPLPRATACEALARIGGMGATERARTLCGSDPSPRVRRAALAALCALASVAEEPQREVVERALANDGDANVRMLAAVKLGARGLSEAVEPLGTALADKDWSVAVCAAVSLGRTQAGPAIAPLAQLSKTATDWKLRAAGVVGLSRLFLKSAIPPVIDALGDTDPFVVKCAHAQLVAVAHETLEPKREVWAEWWAKNEATLLLVDPVKQKEIQARFRDSHTAAPEIFRDLDVVVLESRGDHIEKVLDSQKIAHRLTMAGKIAEAGLTSDGLFVANCTGEIETPDIERLRWFVLVGGHLFGSCWALHETIERALPGAVRKYETGSEVLANVEAFVCADESPFVEGVLTPGVTPRYALEGAHLIEVLEPERVEVLVDSPECAEEFGCGNLAAWFEAGHGTVLDSTNHFEEQGLVTAIGLKKPVDRQAYAVDHMGLDLGALRAVKDASWWENSEKASREITDLSVFRLVTNFVRLRRLELR